MTKGVTQGPELCQMSLSFPDKKMAKNESNRCVCGTISACVFSRLLYAVVWHSLWQLWTFHGARTVREWGEREGWGWVGGWWWEGGGVGITSEADDGVRSLTVSREGVRACMFWHSEVSAHSPIITWWCVMKVRPVCGVKQYQRFHTTRLDDTTLRHHPVILRFQTHLERVLWKHNNANIQYVMCNMRWYNWYNYIVYFILYNMLQEYNSTHTHVY